MISNEFQDKTILIVGGTAGIGAEVALEAARRSARVVVTGRTIERGKEFIDRAAQELPDAAIPPVFWHADATREADAALTIDRIVDEYGALHAAFNNVGGLSAFGAAIHLDADAWRRELDVNLMSVVYGMAAQAPAIQAAGGGAIVNHVGQAGLRGLPFGIAPYVAAKHAVMGLTKCAALELIGSGVRVNAVAPAAVDTPLFRSTVGATADGAAAAAASIPMGRIAAPREVVGAVLYLLSDASSYVTGIALPVDGGSTAR
jgi:NAD(P)-dependent dehydrogenase (short-subunit alcohol dehydrogenase family)